MRSIFYIFAPLLCATALCQTAPTVYSPNLTLETTGHGYWKPHRPFGYRVYSTPDGTKAEARYLTFKNRNEAKQYLHTSLTQRDKVIYVKKTRDHDGQVLGERIVAVRKTSAKKEFTLVRGVRLNYFFIASSSLAAAIQVEEELVQE